MSSEDPPKTWAELVSMKVNTLVVISAINSFAIICLVVAIIILED